MKSMNVVVVLALTLASCADDASMDTNDATVIPDSSETPDAMTSDGSADADKPSPEAGTPDAAGIAPVCTFETMTVDEDVFLYSVGGAAEDEVWIGADDGKAYFYDGATFSAELGASRQLLDVATTASGTYFVTNVNNVSDGRVHRSTGSGIESVYHTPDHVLESLWASPSGEVWAVGEIAVRGSGETWQAVETNPDGLGASYFGAVAGRADDDVVLGTPLGVFRWTGGPYLDITDDGPGKITELDARAGTDYWAISNFDEVYSSSNADVWTLVRKYPVPVRELAVDTANGAWIVVDGRFVDHYDGTGWARYNPLGADVNLTDIAVIGNDVWVVGSTGIAARCARD